MTLMTEPLLAKRFTPEDLLQLPDRNGYELVDGQLEERPVSKESSRIGLQVAWFLKTESMRTGAAETFGADMGYRCFADLGDPDLIRKPDASVIRRERLAGLKGDPGYMPIPADLAVEVLSPNDLWRKIARKVEEYLAADFQLVWIVDPSTRIVVIHRRDGSVTKLHENDEITGESALLEFRCRVADLLK